MILTEVQKKKFPTAGIKNQNLYCMKIIFTRILNVLLFTVNHHSFGNR